MKEIFDNIDDYIIFFNKEKKIVHCNIKLLNKLGYELTDVVNEYIDDKIIKNNDIAIRAIHKKYVNTAIRRYCYEEITF